MLVYRACSHIYVYTTMAASIPALYLRVLRNIYGWAYKVDSNTVVTPLLMVLQNNKPRPSSHFDSCNDTVADIKRERCCFEKIRRRKKNWRKGKESADKIIFQFISICYLIKRSVSFRVEYQNERQTVRLILLAKKRLLAQYREKSFTNIGETEGKY